MRRAGGRALLVPPGEPDPSGLLDAVDGLLLTGGGDIDPSRWDGPAHETVYHDVDRVRDDLELDARAARRRARVPDDVHLPRYAGLNVALGGRCTCTSRTSSARALQHRVMPPRARPRTASPSMRTPRSRGSWGRRDIEPMSWHHQAVDRLGDGLARRRVGAGRDRRSGRARRTSLAHRRAVAPGADARRRTRPRRRCLTRSSAAACCVQRVMTASTAKSALITGAAGEIGRESALLFAARGCARRRRRSGRGPRGVGRRRHRRGRRRRDRRARRRVEGRRL